MREVHSPCGIGTFHGGGKSQELPQILHCQAMKASGVQEERSSVQRQPWWYVYEVELSREQCWKMVGGQDCASG